MKSQQIAWKNIITAAVFISVSLKSIGQTTVADWGLLAAPIGSYRSHTLAVSARSLHVISEKSAELKLSDLKAQVESGRYALETLYQYVALLKQEKLPYEQVVNKHIEHIEHKLSQKSNVGFIWEFSSDLNTQAIDCLLAHKATFENIYGQQNIENQIVSSVQDHVSKAVAQNDIRLLQRAMQVVEKSNMVNAADIYYEIQKRYYEASGDYKSTLQINRLEALHEKQRQNALYWQEKAWNLLMQQPDNGNIQTALRYIERSISLDSQYENNQTHAFLLFKLGKTKQSKRAAQKALQIARKNNQDATGAINLLQHLTK